MPGLRLQRDLCCSWGCRAALDQRQQLPCLQQNLPSCGLAGCGINHILSWCEGRCSGSQGTGIFEDSPSGWEGAPAEPQLPWQPGEPSSCTLGPQPAPGQWGQGSPSPWSPTGPCPTSAIPPDLHFGAATPRSSLHQRGCPGVWGHTRPWGLGVPGLPSCRGLGVSNPTPESLRAVRNLSCPAGSE